jgi:hypothetical protein
MGSGVVNVGFRPSGSLYRSLGRVAELADAQDSGSCVRKDVGVQVPPRPPTNCATDIHRLHRGRCLLPKPLVRGLATQAPVRASVVVEGLPFLELVVEELGGVDDHPLELATELLVIDAMGALHLAVEAGCEGFDVDVADSSIQEMPVESGLEFLIRCRSGPTGPRRGASRGRSQRTGWRSSVRRSKMRKIRSLVQSSMAVNW